MNDYSKITALYSRLSVGDEDRDDGESRIWSDNRQGGGIVNTCPAALF